MMIDREARKRMAVLARGLALGRITNDQFEDSLPSFKNEEELFEIHNSYFWMLYNDTHEHKLTGKYALSPEGKKEVARIILFLRSDFEYRWPTTRHFILIPMIIALLVVLLLCGLGWLIMPVMIVSFIGFPLFKPIDKKNAEGLIKGDDSLWPFFSKEEYEYALANPVYFVGKNKEVSS